MQKIRFIFTLFILLLGNLNAQAATIGQPAPQFTLPALSNDQATTLKQYAGKVIYLDFWASWCAPCRTSFPLLNKLQQKYKDKGFEVVAINLDEDKASAEKFLKDIPVEFTILRDGTGEWADQYVVESMPTSFIIDKQGIIQNIHHGFVSSDIDELDKKVAKLLAD